MRSQNFFLNENSSKNFRNVTEFVFVKYFKSKNPEIRFPY